MKTSTKSNPPSSHARRDSETRTKVAVAHAIPEMGTEEAAIVSMAAAGALELVNDTRTCVERAVVQTQEALAESETDGGCDPKCIARIARTLRTTLTNLYCLQREIEMVVRRDEPRLTCRDRRPETDESARRLEIQ